MAWKHKVKSCQSPTNLEPDNEVRAAEHAEYRGAHLFVRHPLTFVLHTAVRLMSNLGVAVEYSQSSPKTVSDIEVEQHRFRGQ